MWLLETRTSKKPSTRVQPSWHVRLTERTFDDVEPAGTQKPSTCLRRPVVLSRPVGPVELQHCLEVLFHEEATPTNGDVRQIE